MGSEANQAQGFDVGLLVDQHQVRLHVAVPVIVPLAAQRMVVVPRFEGLIVGQDPHDRYQDGIEGRPAPA